MDSLKSKNSNGSWFYKPSSKTNESHPKIVSENKHKSDVSMMHFLTGAVAGAVSRTAT